MFNPAIYENSRAGGFGVLTLAEPGEETPQARFVPLQSTRLRGTVAGPLADLTIVQQFLFTRDQLDRTIEAAYRFPLPGDAAVTGVTVRFGEVEIAATLKPRKAAEEEYARARAEGRQGALLTRESPDVFTLQIAGISPDQEVIVETRYVQLARSEGLDWSIRIPLTTAPRFVRQDDLATAHAKGQPLALLRDPGHRFDLDLSVAAARRVYSPTHQLETEVDADGTRVRLVGGPVLPDRDCVINWAPLTEPHHPGLSVFTHAEDDDLYFLAQIVPPSDAGELPVVAREVLLLVDHSGSMSGAKWQAADWGVTRFLDDLTPDDAFALGVFHTQTGWFRQALASADEERVTEAVAWLNGQSDSGGTNLGVALEQALALPRTEGERARNLLILTDAAVTDAGRVLRLADTEAAAADSRRISILCIDAAPNDYLAHELAERGGGLARFLTSDPAEEDITTALDQLLALWRAPLYTGLRLTVNRSTLQPAGHRLAEDADEGEENAKAIDLGTLAAGQSRWVCGRVPWDHARLSLRLEDDDGALLAAVDAATGEESPWLPAVKALFGVHRINALEALTTARYGREMLETMLQRLGYETPPTVAATGESDALYAENRAAWTIAALDQLLVEESLRYGIASSAAGFVATRREAGSVVEESVVVANALPHGWQMPTTKLGSMRAMGFVPGFRAALEASSSQAVASDMPTPAGMPMPAAQGSPAPGFGGPAPTWHTIVRGTVTLDDGKADLYTSGDEGSAAIPDGVTLSGLKVALPTLTVGREQGSMRLEIYVGDMVDPRAVVALAALADDRLRPLNIRKAPGDRVHIVLIDPTGLCHDEPIEIKLQW